MIIENPDAFKSWLTSILEPLCDADPAALAKYVYALVKKDKPLDELRDGMLDQLDVFLQQETKPFVEMLFKALDSQEYLKPLVADAEQPSPAPEEPDLKREVVEAETNGNGTLLQPTAERQRSPGAALPRGDPPRHRVVVPRSVRPHPPPHQEQTLTKVLPLNQLLEEPVDQPPRRRDRRGDSLRDKEERRRRQSRSWERRNRTRRHPRDLEHNPDARRYDRRRPISRSPSPRGRYRNRSPPPAIGDRQTSRSKSRSPVRDHERERDRLRMPREMERDRMSRDRDHRDRISRSRDRERSRDRSRDRSLSPHPDARLDHIDPYKRRCRDFDVKGYCMRGDLCEWDHGVDPVVLEDAALTRVLIPPPPVPEYNPQAPDIWCGAGFPAFGPPLSLPPPPHPPHAPHTPRELVPIPRVRHEPPIGVMPINPPRHPPPMKKNFDYNRLGPARPPLPANAVNCSLEVKKVPRGLNDITHLNNHFSKFGKIVNIQVCYEGDPEGALITFSNPTEANVAYKSTEAVLNNRFIKVFWHNPENKQENTAPSGQQVNKQTDRQNSQHPMSHNKVLINRDNIKATADNKQMLADKERQAVKEAQSNGQQPPQQQQQASSKRSPAIRARATSAVMDMHRRAQELLQTQLRQQRLLIQRLEDGNVTESQKSTLMEAINAAQEGIEKLRKELVAYNGMLRQMQEESVARSMSRLQLEQVSKKPKTAVEAQKEILDAELDYITKQQEGQDVTELAKKIAEMRRQMSIQFPAHPVTMRRPHSRGGRFNPATRFSRAAVINKTFSVNQTVDHRPRALLVSGFEPEELDSLLAHFSVKLLPQDVCDAVAASDAHAARDGAITLGKPHNALRQLISYRQTDKQFGEVTGKEANLAVPELVLQFKARSQAEQAMMRARHYNDRTLSITWVTNNKPLPVNITTPVHNGDVAQEDNKETEVVSTVGLEPLARFDEEEEEDPDEERSWRR